MGDYPHFLGRTERQSACFQQALDSVVYVLQNLGLFKFGLGHDEPSLRWQDESEAARQVELLTLLREGYILFCPY